MKYYQVHYFDRNDPACSGVISGFYTSKEEAEKCADWHEKHPDPLYNYSCYAMEIDIDNIIEKFVPPMTEEEYQKEMDDYFNPKYDYECYPDDADYPYEEIEDTTQE